MTIVVGSALMICLLPIFSESDSGSDFGSLSLISTTNECHSKQSVVVEIKDKELNPNSESDYENTSKGHIIDVDPTAIVVTATIQPEEPIDPEEGECLFHSQMWVKGTPLHFIVDSGSQKNLISTEVIK